MKWKLEYSQKALRQLRKFDSTQRAIILSWMDKNISDCPNPRSHGKGLTSDHSGKWRYRIGDYRVLCEIKDSELLVLAFKIDHRNKIYRR